MAARGGDNVAGQVGGGGVAAVQPAAVVQLQVVAFFGGDGQAGIGRQGGAVGAFQVGRGGDGGDGEGDVRPCRFVVAVFGGSLWYPAAVVVAQGLGVQPAVALVVDAQRFAVGVLAEAGACGVGRGVYPGFGEGDAGVSTWFARRVEAGVVFALDFYVVHTGSFLRKRRNFIGSGGIAPTHWRVKVGFEVSDGGASLTLRRYL